MRTRGPKEGGLPLYTTALLGTLRPASQPAEGVQRPFRSDRVSRAPHGPTPPSSRRACPVGAAGGPPPRPSTDLPVLVQDVAEQPVGVGEALGAGALADAHHSVLLRVEHAALGEKRGGGGHEGTAYDRATGGHLALAGESAPTQAQGARRPTCLPMGSGLVTVVLKKPSHSRRP